MHADRLALDRLECHKVSENLVFTGLASAYRMYRGRCHQLKVQMTDAEIKQCTARIKALANVRQLTVEDTDFIIRTFSQASQCNSKPGLFAYVPTQQKQTVKAVVVA